MNKYTAVGLLAWLIGIIILGFQSLGSFMEQEVSWADVNLVDLLGAEPFNWALEYSWLYTLFETPIYLLLFGLGLILILMGVVFWRK
ncbi:MAG: hypothetical protein QNI89_18025 [Desulfobacterales bacterium]|nr:hypothetical protein [Desulfobacterales bacterium]MDJ0856266.1 hypothetical protein [Desulfobacterales bacterium]MDJ0889203.1 hypothetical protein [Desulfobacterales bacterium]